jgi:hypothetical protein
MMAKLYGTLLATEVAKTENRLAEMKSELRLHTLLLMFQTVLIIAIFGKLFLAP